VPALDGQWRKATASNNNSACVEARFDGDHVQVRDSKAHGGGAVLRFEAEAWKVFLAGLRAGDFAQ